MKTGLIALIAVSVLGTLLVSLNAADTLPAAINDDTFWRIVSGFSEESGEFRYENLLSNESSYQAVIPLLKSALPPGGAYVGVGPEQNFTYISALEPRIAFVVDIRRQNMLEHLMYKALFELSTDRAGFVSLLFSRRRPAGLNADSTADELFKAYEAQSADALLFNETLADVMDRLMNQHAFPLTATDAQAIKHLLGEFRTKGPKIDYGFVSAPSEIAPPTYSQLMTANDGRGKNWSYLATEENFARVRDMQLTNLIVPLVGNFAGSRTLRSVANYLKQRKAIVTTFYVSNVEQYLKKDEAQRFRTNVILLPTSYSSSMLIRFIPPDTSQIESIKDFRYKGGALFHLLDQDELP